MDSALRTQVAVAADRALGALILAVSPHRLLPFLHELLLLQESTSAHAGMDDVLCAVCSAIQRTLHNMPHGMMSSEAASRLLPGLLACAEHVRVDVRKASVFAVAEMWLALGAER